jgi:hypothetical protein
MLIQLTTGTESFATGAIKITAFVKKSYDADPVPIFLASRDQHSGIRVSRPTDQFPASTLNQDHGFWQQTTFDIPAGMSVKLWVSQKFVHQVFYDNSYFILAVREQASLCRLGVRLSGDQRAARSWAYMEGRFDIIDPVMFEQMNITSFEGELYGSEAWIMAGTENFRYEVLEQGEDFVLPPTDHSHWRG